MNEPKPIYTVKSRNGQNVAQGDFASITNWLKENRVKNDDDLKRDGLHVLEKDELWGRVSDFPEFNFSEREGRRALYRARVRANVWLIICGFILLLGVGLICYDQVIPRYTEAQRVEEAVELSRKSKAAEVIAIQRADEAEAKANNRIKDLQKVSDAKYKALEDKILEEQSQQKDRITSVTADDNIKINSLKNEKLFYIM